MFMLEPLVSELDPGAGDGCSTDGGDVSSLRGQKPDFLHGSLSDILEEDRSSLDVRLLVFFVVEYCWLNMNKCGFIRMLYLCGIDYRDECCTNVVFV